MEVSSTIVTMVPGKAAKTIDFPSVKTQNSTPHAAWGAFQAGMQILQRYANKSPADSATIAKANLRLLYQSLLADPIFLKTLKTTNSAIADKSLPTLHTLLATQELQAELITLPKNSKIPLATRQKGIAMLMLIAGHADIDLIKDPPLQKNNHWWDRLKHPKPNKSFKQGSVILISPSQNEEHILSTEENGCILFSIFLPKASRPARKYTDTNDCAA